MSRAAAALASVASVAALAALASCGGRAGDPGELVAPIVRGCADGAGWPMRDYGGAVRAWACPGAFAGPLGSRCAAGWAPCRKSPIDPLGCQTLGDLPPAYQRGLYVSSVTGWSPGPLPDPRLACGSWAGKSGGTRVLFACGEQGAAVGAATCGGFRVAVGCGSAGSPWQCGTDLGGVANSDPLSGVLCCPAAG